MAAARFTLAFLFLATVACAAGRSANPGPVQNAELRAFDAFADREWPASSEQHGVTIEALNRMFAAIESVTEMKDLSSPAVKAKLQELRAAVTAYEVGTPGAVPQASRLRELFISSAALITDILVTAGLDKPGVDPRLSALGRAADSLGPDNTLLRQGDSIERFFRHASEALKRVDRGA